MTATTQRLTINQTWQQVATGNVTLIGCNTAANYHINIGADKPTDKSAFVTDKLGEPTGYNYNAPVWVKLDVNNQIDEADLIVLGEAVLPAPVAPATPVAPTLLFSSLQNCTYDNESLIYKSGWNLAFTDSEGYQAVSDNPVDFELIYNGEIFHIFIGDNNDPISYRDLKSSGVMCMLANQLGSAIVDKEEVSISFNSLPFSIGDRVSFKVLNNSLTIRNETTEIAWSSPQSGALATPKYFGIVVNGTNPLTIKAI